MSYTSRPPQEVDALSSRVILRCVQDTALRFRTSEGGGKDWRAILQEIISSLPGSSWPSRGLRDNFDIQSRLTDHLTGRNRFTLCDGGDIYFGVCDRRGLIDLSHEDGCYGWHLDNIPYRHNIHSRECAWFLERLRTLGFSDRDDSGIPNTWSCTTLTGAKEAFRQGEMTWFTLVQYLKFVLEESNWTTPLRPPWLPPLTFEEKLKDCYEKILEGSGIVVENEDGIALVEGREGRGGLGSVPIHIRYNQEQTETLTLEQDPGTPPVPTAPVPTAPVPTAPVPTAPSPPSAPSAPSDTAKKREKLSEILSILEEKAEASEIGEGSYKDYADLLMEFSGGLIMSGSSYM
jgi:hypothetical protein